MLGFLWPAHSHSTYESCPILTNVCSNFRSYYFTTVHHHHYHFDSLFNRVIGNNFQFEWKYSRLCSHENNTRASLDDKYRGPAGNAPTQLTTTFQSNRFLVLFFVTLESWNIEENRAIIIATPTLLSRPFFSRLFSIHFLTLDNTTKQFKSTKQSCKSTTIDWLHLISNRRFLSCKCVSDWKKGEIDCPLE